MDQVKTPLSPEGRAEIVERNRLLDPLARKNPVALTAGKIAPYLPGVATSMRGMAAEGFGTSVFNPEADATVGAIGGAIGGGVARVLRGSSKKGLDLDENGYRMLPTDRFELRRENGEKLSVLDVAKERIAKMAQEPMGVLNPLEASFRKSTGAQNQKLFNAKAIEWIGGKMGFDVSQFKRSSAQLYEAVNNKVDDNFAKLNRKTTQVDADPKLARDLIQWRKDHALSYKDPIKDTNTVFEDVFAWLQGTDLTAGKRKVSDVIKFGSLLSHEAWRAPAAQKKAIYALRDKMDEWAVRNVKSLSLNDITQARQAHHFSQLLVEISEETGEVSAGKMSQRMRELGIKPSEEPFAAHASFIATTNSRLNDSGQGAATLIPSLALVSGGAAAGYMANDEKDSQMGTLSAAMLGLGMLLAISPRVAGAMSTPSNTSAIGRMYGKGVIDPTMRAGRVSAADERLKAAVSMESDDDGG